jgi:5-methylcytosine-specific restriction enzyme A
LKKSDVRELVEAGEKNKFYWRSEWQEEIRPAVLDRDHYECQRCLYKWDSEKYPNVRPKKLTRASTVHHIYPLEQYPEYAKEMWNLVSLCYRCHNEVEGRNWFKFKAYKRLEKPQVNEERW